MIILLVGVGRLGLGLTAVYAFAMEVRLMSLAGTHRWGEFGEGGLLLGECTGKNFEWFNGGPADGLLCKVCVW
ncbi:hypothetical protein AMTR_s00039p00128120 [Amborella trichopoda]|uniref:Uncharacterized protein n=1 Tax=Amborella trichopoda TaxID=13333 RepID=U5D040_AMBTC|nr:hypothetical protein AMTR_s00039p00128120 [Amborella trichopoda]